MDYPKPAENQPTLQLNNFHQLPSHPARHKFLNYQTQSKYNNEYQSTLAKTDFSN